MFIVKIFKMNYDTMYAENEKHVLIDSKDMEIDDIVKRVTNEPIIKEVIKEVEIDRRNQVWTMR